LIAAWIDCPGDTTIVVPAGVAWCVVAAEADPATANAVLSEIPSVVAHAAVMNLRIDAP
jgi:hypothetical protein